MKLPTDERGVILAWLLRVAIVLALVALFLYEGAVLALNFLGLDSAANDMAVALSRVATERRLAGATRCDPATTPASSFCQQAEELANEARAELVSAELTTDGVVQVTLRREADTLVVHRIGPLEDWTVATADGSAGV